jgi:hypothetical protein
MLTFSRIVTFRIVEDQVADESGQAYANQPRVPDPRWPSTPAERQRNASEHRLTSGTASRSNRLGKNFATELRTVPVTGATAPPGSVMLASAETGFNEFAFATGDASRSRLQRKGNLDVHA